MTDALSSYVDVDSYGPYSNNYGTHCLRVQFPGPSGHVTVWYSYRTPIAVSSDATGCVVRQNAWGPTTGKHLNAIDDGNKSERVSDEAFEAALNTALGVGYNATVVFCQAHPTLPKKLQESLLAWAVAQKLEEE